MAKTKYYNKDTQKWEYAETGCIPVRGTHYWTAQDLKPLRDYVSNRVMSTAEVCFLTVGVTSNQPDKSVFEGLALSVTYPDGRTSEAVPGDVVAFTEGSVTVQFPEVEGYKRPDNLSVAYVKGNVAVTGTYLAEEVTVNALVDGAASGDYSYEVSGDGIVCLTGSGTAFTGVTKWLVPHGVTITVTPATVDGYTTSAVTHTASGVTGSVSVEWKGLPYGVYIQDTTGAWWSTGRWDDSATPICVAVYSAETPPFAIHLELDTSSRVFTGSAGQQIGYAAGYYMSTCETQAAALAWTGGAAAAKYIQGRIDKGLSSLSSSSAFHYSLNYNSLTSSPGGQTYPAMLCELNLLYQNKDAVNAALAKVGDASLDAFSTVWSCTKKEHNLGVSVIWTDWWIMDMSTGEMSYVDMYDVADSLYHQYICCVEVTKPETFYI